MSGSHFSTYATWQLHTFSASVNSVCCSVHISRTFLVVCELEFESFWQVKIFQSSYSVSWCGCCSSVHTFVTYLPTGLNVVVTRVQFLLRTEKLSQDVMSARQMPSEDWPKDKRKPLWFLSFSERTKTSETYLLKETTEPYSLSYCTGYFALFNWNWELLLLHPVQRRKRS